MLSLLVFVGVRVPLLHHGIVEVLVGKEAGTEDHGQADGQDGSHHAAVDDGVDTFPSLPLLLLPILVFILRIGNYIFDACYAYLNLNGELIGGISVVDI